MGALEAVAVWVCWRGQVHDAALAMRGTSEIHVVSERVGLLCWR